MVHFVRVVPHAAWFAPRQVHGARSGPALADLAQKVEAQYMAECERKGLLPKMPSPLVRRDRDGTTVDFEQMLLNNEDSVRPAPPKCRSLPCCKCRVERATQGKQVRLRAGGDGLAIGCQAPGMNII